MILQMPVSDKWEAKATQVFTVSQQGIKIIRDYQVGKNNKAKSKNPEKLYKKCAYQGFNKILSFTD
jgi:hypothetical protein